MTDQTVALPFRTETILGVCEAIGQDFGFNANWLRVPFAALILISPMWVIGTYLALGVVVAFSRWMAPNTQAPAAPQPAAGYSNSEQLQLAA
jgi:phage shock protein PspC (stress-responsive transcriptional regulator)